MVPVRSHVCEGPKEDENRYSYNAKARSGFGPPLEGGGNANALLPTFSWSPTKVSQGICVLGALRTSCLKTCSIDFLHFHSSSYHLSDKSLTFIALYPSRPLRKSNKSWDTGTQA